MTFVDWLASGDGILLTHTVVVLMVAVTAFMEAKTHQRIKALKRELDGKQSKRPQRVKRMPPPAVCRAQTDVGTE